MRNRTKTELGWLVALGLWLCSPKGATAADGATAGQPAEAAQVTLQCAPRVGKGRILCDADLTVESGRLSWADIVIIQAPSFAPPLRDRVGMRAASERSANHLRLPFALIAQEPGQGQVTIKARGVWCKPSAGAPESCSAVTKTASSSVIVTEPGS
jgi:hypothetical protein